MNRIKIETTLINIGMPIGIKGFSYITDIVLLLDKPEWKNPKWSALYYSIGNMYNVPANSVEHAIRHALKTTRDRNNNYDAIEYYIGFSNCENSNSIMNLYHRIKHEEEKTNISQSNETLKTFLLQLLATI